MKTIAILLVTTLVSLGASCQVTGVSNPDSLLNDLRESVNPVYGASMAQPLDSNEAYKHIREGLVMQGGQLKIVRNGSLFVMHGPFPLKNGAMVYTNGIIKMPDGSTPLLAEKDYLDFDGQIKPLQSAEANNIGSLTNPFL
jgi:hypothetical protein